MLDPPPPPTRAFQDKRPPKRWWSREDLLLLILLGALFYLPGLGQVPLFDRDEPRFATAARTMVESHNYIVPYFNGQLRPDKPPLVYWLMDLSYSAVGSFNELGARLPSAVCSILTLLVVYFMVGTRFGRVTGLLASIILGSCALCVVESRLATADATMLLFIVTCMGCAWQAWDAGNSAGSGGGGHLPRTDYLVDRATGRTPPSLDFLPRVRQRHVPFAMAILFWVALAAGTMTKGVPLFFVLVPMVILSLATGTLPAQLRQWRSHLHVTGIRIGIALAIAVVVVTVISGAAWIPGVSDARWAAAIIGALLVGMVLTPGLPGILFRCFTGGNWAWWKKLRPLLGIPLLIILVGWWVVLAGINTHWKLIDDMVGVQFLNRVAGPLLKMLHIHIADPTRPGGNDSMASYSQPPGFYLAAVWVTFWPWSVLLVPAAWHAFRRVMGKTAIAIDRRPYQFLLAWIIPMWILLELSRGKLLHYPLPLYVAIAILCADAVVQGWHRLTDVFAASWFAGIRWIVLAIWIGMGIVILAGANRFLDRDLFWRCVPLAGAIWAAGVAGAIAWNRPSWPFVTVLGWACTLLLLNTVVMPDLSFLHLGKDVGQTLAAMKNADPSIHLAAQGFEQPTVVFYAGGLVEMPTLDAQGNAVSMIDKIPFAPRQIPGPNDKYLLAVDQPRKDLLDALHLKYYVRQKISVYEVIHLQRVLKTVYIVSNVPPPPETQTSEPAAITAASAP